ncbi:TPA: chromosome assembly protein [Methanosarcinaceae archaeon]|nr:chromosome assembly protein [Methanosarcinaceae archaeon]
MGIKDIMDSFKKNPVDKLNTRDLQEEEIRLKNRMERIRKDINKIEKDKKQKFQEGVGADMMKKKMLAQEIKQLDTEARLKLKNFTTINKQYMFISNLTVVKKYEQDLKKNKIWDKIGEIGSENFESALINTSLVGKDFDEVLNDLNRVFEMDITDFEAGEDEAESQLLDAWSSVESGAMDVEEVEQTISLEKSLEKEREETEF